MKILIVKIKAYVTNAQKTVTSMLDFVQASISCRFSRMTLMVNNTRGEGFIEVAVKVISAIVIGLLLLGFFYALFNTTLNPIIKQKLTEMFNYSGS